MCETFDPTGVQSCLNDRLQAACATANKELVEILINECKRKKYEKHEKNFSKYMNDGLQSACLCGHKEIAELLIEKGAHNFNKSMIAACEGGYIELVKIMIKKGANNWDKGFLEACKNGHFEIAKLMLENNKDSKNGNIKNLDIYQAFYYAAINGYDKIAKLLVDNGYNEWEHGLARACEGGNLTIVKLMIDNGAKNLEDGMRIASRKHKHLVEFFIEKGVNNWNSCLYSACYSGQRNIAELLIEKGANDVNYGLSEACDYLQEELAVYMISKGANINNCTMNLSDNSIEYLIKCDIKNYNDKFTEQFNRIRNILELTKNRLNKFLYIDLVQIIIKY